MTRRLAATLCAALALITLPCAAATQEAAAPPQADAPTSSARASRVVTLAPHITELVFAAGAGDSVVATVTSSDYPPASRALPRVGDGLTINVEQLLTLDPDLVIAWQPSRVMEKLTPTLAGLGVPVIYSAPRVLDDIPADILRLGQRMGTSRHAAVRAQALQEEIDTLRAQYSGRQPVSVFIEVGTAPLYTLGDDTLTNDAIASCGGVNVFADAAVVAPAVTPESVLLRQPDAVIVASADPQRLSERTAYWHGLHLEAARQAHIHGIDPDALVRPGPRLIDATHSLCEILESVRTAGAHRD